MPRQNNSKPIKTTQVNTQLTNQNNSRPVTHHSSLVDSIKQGFGFGIGSSLAKNILSSTPPINESKNTCLEYYKCLESNDKYECFGNLDKNEYLNCKMNIII